MIWLVLMIPFLFLIPVVVYCEVEQWRLRRRVESAVRSAEFEWRERLASDLAEWDDEFARRYPLPLPPMQPAAVMQLQMLQQYGAVATMGSFPSAVASTNLNYSPWACASVSLNGWQMAQLQYQQQALSSWAQQQLPAPPHLYLPPFPPPEKGDERPTERDVARP